MQKKRKKKKMTISVIASTRVVEKKISASSGSDGNINPAFVDSTSFRSSLRLNMFDIDIELKPPIRNQSSSRNKNNAQVQFRHV